jgi:YgiT-type zinc finger domain-containing protein
MKCVVCKQAEVVEGAATVTLERDRITLVVKNVPARVCPNCGERYVDEHVTRQLVVTAESAARAGVQVDVREYIAAQR